MNAAMAITPARAKLTLEVEADELPRSAGVEVLGVVAIVC